MDIVRFIVTVLIAFIVAIFFACGVMGKNVNRESRIGWTFTTCVLLMAMYFMWF